MAAGGPRIGEEWRGAVSCAAAACHNGGGPRGSRGSEYTTWVVHDPHARAFEALYDKRSVQIEQSRARRPGEKQMAAEDDPLCLNRHTAFARQDGVGCEACHGAAGGWLTRHYTGAWRGKTAAQKEAEGMRNTKDLRVRAEVCVRCHVGEGDADVGHDLIAAGHPRLNFEFSAFLANVPKHWSAEKDKAGRPDFEARAWAIGQVVSARAALELLAHRADEENRRPWPEFAEYDCYACHHDLKAASPRRERNPRTAPPGTLAWGTWYLSLLPDALGDEAPKELTGELSALRGAMQAFGADRQDVAVRTRSASEMLAPRVGNVAGPERDDATLHKALRRFAADGAGLSRANWDGAAQLYLAIAAHWSACGDSDPRRRDAVLNARIRDLGQRLSFPPPGPGGRLDSPDEDCLGRFREALHGVQQALQK
jgi:hypothetical protein